MDTKPFVAVASADDLTDAEIKVEIARMMREMAVLRQQMQRDHESTMRSIERSDATMAIVCEELAKMRASR